MESFPQARPLLLGGVAANLTAVAVVFVANWVKDKFDSNATVVVAVMALNVALVPVLIGLVAGWSWRRLPLGFGALSLHSGWVAMMGLVGAAVVFSEGIVCLVMVAPFYYALIFAGVQLGCRLFRNDPGNLRVTLLPLLVVGMIAESRFAPPPEPAVFTDELHIAAPPAAVWPHVVSFAPIPAPPDFWMFRLGLPYPVETPPGADAVGKERLCVFSHGVVFKERVAVFEPGHRLVFDIVEQPKDPELLGHFEARQGEFELRAEPDGTTTLIGRSTYVLHTRPRWYFGWWTRYLGSAVHLRVMENVRRLAESR